MAIDLGRRQFVSTLGGVAVAWPLAARAQQPTLPVVGFLNVGTADGNAPLAAAFRRGLSEAGYTDGQNIAVEYRWADGHFDQLPSLAADLVHRQVTVIAATTTPGAMAAKATGTTIPIVFETAGDPIKLGLVKSLNHPGDNLTGVTQLSSELISKRLGLLHDLIPTAKLVGLLVDRADPRAEAQATDMQEAARGLGLQIDILNASNEAEIDRAFADISRVGARGLLVGTGEFLRRRADQVVSLAAQQSLPAIYQYSDFARAGGLISYGTSLIDSGRIIATTLPFAWPLSVAGVVAIGIVPPGNRSDPAS